MILYLLLSELPYVDINVFISRKHKHRLTFIFADIVVSGTYIYDGYYWYGFINLSLVLIPTLLVQIFSIRWFQMDSMMKKSYWYIHASLLGVVQR